MVSQAPQAGQSGEWVRHETYRGFQVMRNPATGEFRAINPDRNAPWNGTRPFAQSRWLRDVIRAIDLQIEMTEFLGRGHSPAQWDALQRKRALDEQRHRLVWQLENGLAVAHQLARVDAQLADLADAENPPLPLALPVLDLPAPTVPAPRATDPRPLRLVTVLFRCGHSGRLASGNGRRATAHLCLCSRCQRQEVAA